jgi:hypothetical protein
MKPAHQARTRLRARLRAHGTVAFVILIGSLVVGIGGYWLFAGMAPLDGFLNAAMLLSGMGPVGELQTPAAKIFAGCYALYAGIVFVGLAGYIMAPVLHHFVAKFRLEDSG